MDLIGVLFILLSFLCLSSSLGLVFSDFVYPFTPLLLGLSILLFSVGCIIFWFATRICFKRLEESHFRLSKKIASMISGSQTIIFIIENGTWVCAMNNYRTSFDLRGFCFKKSFLTAFVIRAIRYPIISNKKPIHYLSKLKLKGLSPRLIVKVRFNNKTETTIAKNGSSYFRLLSWAITKSKTPPSREYHTSKHFTFGQKVIQIDERIFNRL